jgi:toxin HigB-1
LEISFRTNKLCKECNDYTKLVKRYGPRCAKRIRHRLDELADVDCLDDIRRLPQARCHELEGNRKGQLAVDLEHPRRLVFSPDHDPIPSKSDGGLDWKAVSAIMVLRVEDYHGKR